MLPGTQDFQLSLSLVGPPPGHLSDQGSPAAPTPVDPHHKGSVGKGDSLRPSFGPGVPPRRGQLSRTVGATGEFFHQDVTRIARANIPALASTIASACGSASASTSTSASAHAFAFASASAFVFAVGWGTASTSASPASASASARAFASALVFAFASAPAFTPVSAFAYLARRAPLFA